MFELILPISGTLHEACTGPMDARDRERCTLPLLAGFPEILAFFRRRIGQDTPLSIIGPDNYPGHSEGSFEIISSPDEPFAYASPYNGPTKPHPEQGKFGVLVKA